MNIVYKLTFSKRKSLGIKPYYYIGSKTKCSYENGCIIDSFNKPYYSSCEQDRFISAISNEIPIVDVLEEDINTSELLERERFFQEQENAVKSEEYFNLVYAGGGFGLLGERSEKAKANMKAANYMNKDDFRPWKTSRANPEVWKRSDEIYLVYCMLQTDTRYNSTIGWRRVKSKLNFDITDCEIKSIVKYFKSGWIPLEDLEFISLKNS